ncbi:hypothetical protein Daesc_003910 [Daldinia eschscholtzii]|uniref:Agroclavine dehydrogenase n=1 Tax=Daldinia eschscholtzii TaxID=292717 RepID=A0AAX6MMS5_9PEZI
MTILLLGGRGKTASRIASLLHGAGRPFLVASRSTTPDSPYHQAVFDWTKPDTYENPFAKALVEGLSPISAVYLVPPPISDNFSSQDEQQNISIKKENKIYSATGNGKLPFVSADDIARVGFCALTDEKLQNAEHIILGPDLLTYGDVATILSSTLRRKITHVNLSEDELVKLFESTGMPVEDARMLAEMDSMVKNGVEERLNHVVEEVTGTPPVSFKDFAVRNRSAWVWNSA